MRKLLLAALATLLVGCGSSTDFQQAGGLVLPANLTTLTGRVVNESGSGLSGVRVVVHERTSNAKHEGVSNSDGTFRFNLLSGVYDLGLDREGDPFTATCFYGPVETGAEAKNFVLRSANGRTNEKVFGKIWLRDGVPAAQRQVNLVSAHGKGVTDKPADIGGRTDADGSFELSLDSDNERAMDLEIYDGSDRLHETVDFGKLTKPCYVEIATEQTPTKNLLRAGQSELAGVQATSSDPTGVEKFAYRQFKAPDQTDDDSFEMTGGLLPVDNTVYRMIDLVSNPDDAGRLTLGVQPQQIRVAADGMWWWKYAVHIGYPGAGDYSFTDQTADTYSLWISSITPIPINWHKVSYNSKSPAVVKIVFEGAEDDE